MLEVIARVLLYVTLEPCCHFGKTPPCSDLIVKHQIPNVVIGCIDDNPEVAGKGIKKLKAAGCNVIVGVLERECKAHHKRFFTFHNKKRPYIILKWAQSQDGFIAPLTKDEQKPVWITNPYSRLLVHKWRAEEQAILVGTNTVIADNPSLTTRNYKGKNPIRVVIDRTKRLPKSASIFDNASETIIISEDNINYNSAIAAQICDILHQKDINSVIIEGGTQTLQTFIDEGLWDEARLFTGTLNFKEGVKAPLITGKTVEEQHIENDKLTILIND